MAGKPHIEAQVEFRTAKAGGRTSSVASGYRGLVAYNGRNWIAEQTYPETSEVCPGDRVLAQIRFLSPQQLAGEICVGSTFAVREGSKIVAKGVVTRVFRQVSIDAAKSSQT